MEEMEDFTLEAVERLMETFEELGERYLARGTGDYGPGGSMRNIGLGLGAWGSIVRGRVWMECGCECRISCVE